MKNDKLKFHSYIIKGVTNLKTDQNGWRIVGLWGNEEKGEGNRIGPTFSEDQLQACESLMDELEAKYGLPVDVSTIITHFTGIKIGQKVKTDYGDGIIEDITVGPFPVSIKLGNGGYVWVDEISKREY